MCFIMLGMDFLQQYSLFTPTCPVLNPLECHRDHQTVTELKGIWPPFATVGVIQDSIHWSLSEVLSTVTVITPVV